MPLITFENKGALKNIYSVKEFRAILGHECIRSDRTGSHFSLVVLYIQDIDIKKTLHGLAIYLKQRLRSIDEAGWLDDNTIGLLLPETQVEGANKVASDLCNKFETGKPFSSYDVYIYPSDFLSNSNNNSSQEKSNKSTKLKGKLYLLKSNDSQAYNIRNIEENMAAYLAYRMPVWKRVVDIIGSLSGLIILFPLLLIVAIIIKIVSPGPVFYKGERTGYMCKTFNCLKFRTMHPSSITSTHEQHVMKLMECDEPFTKLDDNDHRIIPLGKLLRKTGLDEIPQLINVLKGEMSLVGPRPDLCYSVSHYNQWQKRRLIVVPGLTGLWQTNGKNNTSFKDMIRFDITYIKNRSFFLDLKIILKTVPAIIIHAYFSRFRQDINSTKEYA